MGRLGGVEAERGITGGRDKQKVEEEEGKGEKEEGEEVEPNFQNLRTIYYRVVCCEVFRYLIPPKGLKFFPGQVPRSR